MSPGARVDGDEDLADAQRHHRAATAAFSVCSVSPGMSHAICRSPAVASRGVPSASPLDPRPAPQRKRSSRTLLRCASRRRPGSLGAVVDQPGCWCAPADARVACPRHSVRPALRDYEMVVCSGAPSLGTCAAVELSDCLGWSGRPRRQTDATDAAAVCTWPRPTRSLHDRPDRR